MARRFGVRVEEFAFGFPPRVASMVRNGTRYALNLIPLGGYVKIYGESASEGTIHDPESFASRPLFQRFFIIASGVVMNVLLSWVLFSSAHALGLPTVLDENEASQNARVTVIGIEEGSPAETSGFLFGDGIAEVSSNEEALRVERIEDVQHFVGTHRGMYISVRVRRGDEEKSIAIEPRVNPPDGEGPLGIAMARVGIVRSPIWRAPWDGLKTTASASVAITVSLAHAISNLVSKGTVPSDISGPIGIFTFADQSRRLGLVYLVELAGVLSINLALLNILPIPALDGGRILFLAIEKIRGIRVNEKIEQMVHTVGFVILILLMAAITYRDIVRFF